MLTPRIDAVSNRSAEEEHKSIPCVPDLELIIILLDVCASATGYQLTICVDKESRWHLLHERRRGGQGLLLSVCFLSGTALWMPA